SAVILAEGLPEKQCAMFLGDATNNIAEYSGVILALEQARQLGIDQVEVFSDSNLCVQQIKGAFKVSSENLLPLYNRVKYLLGHFSKWEINHIPREQNKRADALSNLVLDLHKLISQP
ncbi:MAG TPA: ribonuclease HI family protein, partial [Firmicutes bacterium]|nr:ribonuclease HI family protein [Bacillota bacterium]